MGGNSHFKLSIHIPAPFTVPIWYYTTQNNDVATLPHLDLCLHSFFFFLTLKYISAVLVIRPSACKVRAPPYP